MAALEGEGLILRRKGLGAYVTPREYRPRHQMVGWLAKDMESTFFRLKCRPVTIFGSLANVLGNRRPFILSMISRNLLVYSLLFATAAWAQNEPAAQARAIPISYNLPKAGKTSLAIYDKQGRMVRELLRAFPQGPGAQTVRWDGRDRGGKPAAAGVYSWKLLTSPGLEAEYLLSVGTSVGHQHWPGAHGGPCAVAVSGGMMAVAGAGAEGPPGLASVSLDNKEYRWAAPNLRGWDAASDLAFAGDRLWVQYPGDGSTHALDAATGKVLGPRFTHQVPVMALALQGEKQTVPTGFTALPLSVYSAQKGYGWKDLESLASFEQPAGPPMPDGPGPTVTVVPDNLASGHLATDVSGKTTVPFLVDVPKAPAYPGLPLKVRLHLGGGNPSKGLVHVKAEGAWVASFDPAKVKNGMATMEFAISVMDGQMTLEFYQDKAPNFSFALRGIEVYASADRLATGSEQVVVGATGAQTVLWLKPDGPPTPAFARLPQGKGMGTIGNNAVVDERSNLLLPPPGGPQRSAGFWSTDRGDFDINLNLSDDAPHQVALYFAAGHPDKERAMRVQVLDAATDAVLDTREAKAVRQGEYLVWNLRGSVKLRLTSTVLGGPYLNGVFFDPPAAAAEGRAVFVKSDQATRGNWQGIYGKDGFSIAGDPGRVADFARVPNLQDVALLADGSVLAISGDTLVTLSRAAKQPVVRVKGLVAAAHLAVDPKTGDIFVAQLGDSQQVLKYSRNYKLTGTYGRVGGRRLGRYVPEDFKDISNIAADGQGGFVVTEWLSPPRRTGHFDGTGKWLRDWYGGQQFYNYPGVDPQDPSRVWVSSQFGSVVEFGVDYAKRTSKVLATYNYKEEPFLKGLLQPWAGFTVNLTPITIRQGTKSTRYVWSAHEPGFLLRPDEETGHLVPVALASCIQDFRNLPEEHPWIQAMKKSWPNQNLSEGRVVHRGFTWTDLNNDGQMQADEFRLGTSGGFYGTGVERFTLPFANYMDSKLTSWQGRGQYGTGIPAWSTLPAVSYSAAGLPVWDYNGIVNKGGVPNNGPITQFDNTESVRPDEKGSVYTLHKGNGDGYSAGRSVTYFNGHGFGWPATMLDATSLIKRKLNGEEIWRTGPHHSGFDGPRGRLHSPVCIAGIVKDGGYIGVGDKVKQPLEVWDADGLYVGGLFDRRAKDGLPGRVYSWWRQDESKDDSYEGEGNQALIQYDSGQTRLAEAPNGDVLYFGAGWNNVPVYRINGWQDIQRQNGTFQVAANPVAAEDPGAGLKGEYFANTELKDAPTLLKTAAVWFGYKQPKPLPWPDNDVTKKPFSVRWTGTLQARFTENYRLAVYAKQSGARLWVDGKLVIDQWDKEGKFSSPGIPMVAGGRYAIKLEWRQLGANPEAHLCWESLSTPIEHVPAANLYP